MANARGLTHNLMALAALAAIAAGCGGIERDNPVDPGTTSALAPGGTGMASASPSLWVNLPIPKALISIVHRVVARLEGPGIQPVEKELSLSPLGPATGTIGTLQPGSGRTLTVEGFDLEDSLIFSGFQDNITIAVGETTAVVLELYLTRPLPDPGDDQTGDASAGSGAAKPADGGS
jgi:hypothetical protein